MNSPKFFSTERFVKIGLPLLLAVLSVTTQFLSGATLSQRETQIITAVEFVASLWLGWVLQSFSAERQFLDKQKKFAISALRRILEIEEVCERLIKRLNLGNNSTQIESQVIKEMVVSLAMTVRSSKADWADIIGEEIKNFEALRENLKSNESSDSAEILPEKEVVTHLSKKIPYSLEVQSANTSRTTFYEEMGKWVEKLQKDGFIDFDAFGDGNFPKDIFSLNVGDQLLISIDDTPNRPAGLIAHALTGEAVGVILNNTSGMPYFHFVEVFVRTFNQSKVTGEYLEKGITGTSKKEKMKYHHFKVRVKRDQVRDLM